MKIRFVLPVLLAVILLSLRSFVSASPTLQGTIPANTLYLPAVSYSLPPPTPTPTLTPVPTDTPLPPPTPTNSPPTATPRPTATPAPQYICSYNAYNCSNFSRQSQAQAVYEYCLAQVGYDVHILDNDDDGIACESLPDLLGDLQAFP